MIDYHTTTRIPVNDDYAATIGKAVYVFSYYEWTIIYIIDFLKTGFVSKYSRAQRPMTSGMVKKKLEKVIIQNVLPPSPVTKMELDNCCIRFQSLIEKRNALIHAHPITEKDGSQILAYQADPTRAISDMIWPIEKVQDLIQEIDEAAVEAGKILDKFRITKI
jgi:hypothetical protein